MGEFALTIPVLGGRSGALEELARIVSASKRREYEESKRRLRIDREVWFLETSMTGDTWMIFEEGKDIERSFSEWMASQEPFDVWLKEQMREITGIEFSGTSPRVPRRLLRYPLK